MKNFSLLYFFLTNIRSKYIFKEKVNSHNGYKVTFVVPYLHPAGCCRLDPHALFLPCRNAIVGAPTTKRRMVAKLRPLTGRLLPKARPRMKAQNQPRLVHQRHIQGFGYTIPFSMDVDQSMTPMSVYPTLMKERMGLSGKQRITLPVKLWHSSKLSFRVRCVQH